MKSGKHTFWRHVGAIMCCVLMVLVTVACSSDEGSIKSTLEKGLDALKDPSEKSLASLIDTDDTSFKTLSSYGIDPYELLQHAFGRMDYELGDIAVADDGASATAKVTIKNIDIASAISATTKAYGSDDNAETLRQTYANSGTSGLVKGFFAALYKNLDAQTKTITTNVTIRLSKTDGTWKIDNSSIKDLVSAACGGGDISSLAGDDASGSAVSSSDASSS